MKLIEKLERKLSFRRKHFQLNLNSSLTNNEIITNNKKSIKDSTIQVIGTEFSSYISFNNNKNVSLPMPDIAYQLIDIKTNLPRNNVQLSLNNQCKEQLEQHIYDDIQPIKHSNDTHSPNNCKRNRIRTNPWYNSRFGINKLNSNDLLASIYKDDENPYESLDNLIISKENSSQTASTLRPPLSTFDLNVRRKVKENHYSKLSGRSTLDMPNVGKFKEKRTEYFNDDEHTPTEQWPMTIVTGTRNDGPANLSTFQRPKQTKQCTEKKISVTKNTIQHRPSFTAHQSMVSFIGNDQLMMKRMAKLKRKIPDEINNDDDDDNDEQEKFNYNLKIKRTKRMEPNQLPNNIDQHCHQTSSKISKLKSELQEIVHVAIEEAKRQ